jgi:hypothetical protein
MLITKALAMVLTAWDKGELSTLPDSLVKEKVLVALFQALVFTVEAQHEDGSWGKSHNPEETAYAILTVNTLASLSLARPLLSRIHFSIDNGRMFLMQKLGTSRRPDLLWIDKVTYGSNTLSQSYILSALKCSPPEEQIGPCAEIIFPRSLEQVLKPTKFYMRLPLFAKTEEWRIQAALVEGALFSNWLRSAGLNIFPRKDMREEKYLEFIPFTWTAGARGEGVPDAALAAGVSADMMALSALIYQVDEFMESVVGSLPKGSMPEVRAITEAIFSKLEKEISLNGHKRNYAQFVSDGPVNFHNGSTSMEEVSGILTRFVRFVLQHPHISRASTYDKRQLFVNLKAFLFAHLVQVADNTYLASQPLGSRSLFATPRTSFFDWIRTTSAEHTGGPFAFYFLMCLVSSSSSTEECSGTVFSTAAAAYVAEDVSRHLATLCRMYNDLGSVARDGSEGNLNSINYPEFSFQVQNDGSKSNGVATRANGATIGATTSSVKDSGHNRNGEITSCAVQMNARKEELMRIVEYERSCLDLALAKLRDVVRDQKLWKIVKAFCDVTDLYGQMYVVKDLTPELIKRE